jgi:hypothetical protein
MKILLMFAGTLTVTGLAMAQGCSVRSPVHTVALVELYTSEGCSSCPPADQFLASRRAAGLRHDQAVLLSLHVDYWNYIGWKDPFSHAVFTARQRRLSDLARTRTIYTPEFFAGAKEVRNWQGDLDSLVRQINAKPARATIGIEIGQAGPAGIAVEVKSQARPGDRLFVARVQSGIATKVGAGENSGRLLRHDFVVREFTAPIIAGADGKAFFKQQIRVPRTPADIEFAAFVETDSGEVLQAVSSGACSARK